MGRSCRMPESWGRLIGQCWWVKVSHSPRRFLNLGLFWHIYVLMAEVHNSYCCFVCCVGVCGHSSRISHLGYVAEGCFWYGLSMCVPAALMMSEMKMTFRTILHWLIV